MDVKTLYQQFMKGTAYFNQQYADNNKNPVVMRQVADFERQVIVPMDSACAKMSRAELNQMEADYVPF